MKFLFALVIISSLSGCYTTLYHPGPVRSESSARLESCGACHDDARDDMYFSENHLRPLVQRVESDAVEEFVELTRVRERQTDNVAVVLSNSSQAIGIGTGSGFANVSAQATQLEAGAREVSNSRRSYGLRKMNKKDKEHDHR